MGCLPLNLRRFSTDGPPPANARPCNPSEAQLTADCGPPDRVATVGCATRGLIESFSEVELAIAWDISGS